MTTSSHAKSGAAGDELPSTTADHQMVRAEHSLPSVDGIERNAPLLKREDILREAYLLL